MELTYSEKEHARHNAFQSIWNNEINNVFADVASYYDRINWFASLGMLDNWRQRFLSTVKTRPGARVLDVCAGTNVIGIDLLKQEPSLRVHAIDRSADMQRVGRERARKLGFEIDSTISDVHKLPFPDNHFDIVTLQYASRHLRIMDVFSEINRVLKPGGHFYHCDMLRPSNRIVEHGYYLYLRACLALLSWAFRSGSAAVKCQRYFIDAIRMFYSTEELSAMLKELGYSNVVGRSVMGGAVAFHQACKP
ncbi:MAG: class I SAM-dependent methyltransferase [Gammaproteobacteria bacterium]|nr:class I SAM-dependent methyltransferase [Gammaproteobacteria bacterium]